MAEDNCELFVDENVMEALPRTRTKHLAFTITITYFTTVCLPCHLVRRDRILRGVGQGQRER